MAMVSTQSLSFPSTELLHQRPNSLLLSSSSSTYHFTPIRSRSSSSSINHLKLNESQTRSHNLVTTTRASSSSSSVSESEYSSDAIADILGDVSIFAASGEPVLLKNLWDQKQGMAVLVLLRHFGCPCCWELASALKDSKQRFDSAGVKLIAVGVGTPNKAQLLAQRLPFPLDCLYCDPDRKLYDVLGLYYGLARTFFNPASAKVLSRFDSLREAVKNYTIEATPDDRSGVLQQGGMFVFKGKQLLYSRKDEGTGDHAPLEEILDICCTSSVEA